MKKSKYQRLVELIQRVDPAVLLAAVALCDGHSILAPQAFLDTGLPAEVVTHITTTYKSDESPKGTIYVKGKAVKELKGVYGLDLLRYLAGALDVEYEAKLGRGSQAKAIQHALHQHLSRLAKPST